MPAGSRWRQRAGQRVIRSCDLTCVDILEKGCGQAGLIQLVWPDRLHFGLHESPSSSIACLLLPATALNVGCSHRPMQTAQMADGDSPHGAASWCFSSQSNDADEAMTAWRYCKGFGLGHPSFGRMLVSLERQRLTAEHTCEGHTFIFSIIFCI